MYLESGGETLRELSTVDSIDGIHKEGADGGMDGIENDMVHGGIEGM